MKSYRQKLGSWGEQAAADFLQSQGYTILDRNVRTQYGEIDLIAIQEPGNSELTSIPPDAGQAVIVFVEVKTRTSIRYGLPEESITEHKRTHLLNAIQAYMQSHDELPPDWRVDVIAILRPNRDQAPEIIHFANAIC